MASFEARRMTRSARVRMPSRRFAAAIVALGFFASGSYAESVSRVFGDRYIGDGVRFRRAAWDDDLYPVSINNWWGHINQHGYLVVFPQFEWADHAHGGLARVVLGGRTGFVDSTGTFVIEPVYTYADRFEEGLAIVGDGKHVGFINRFEVQVVAIELDGALRFREGMAAIQRGSHCGFIDSKGQTVIAPRFVRVRSFHDGLAVAEEPGLRGKRGHLGYIDKTGNYVFVDAEYVFEDLGSFSDGLAPARIGRKWGYIDREFRVVVEPQFDRVRRFAGGLAAVKQNGKWGYIEKIQPDDEKRNGGESSPDEEAAPQEITWKMAVEPTFELAFEFDEVLALVRRGGKWGFVDREGNAVIAPQFASAEPYSRGLARASQEPQFGYFGVEANIVWDPRGPADGIFDLTHLDRARNPLPMNLPRPRRATRAPYNPEYLYEDVLPD